MTIREMYHCCQNIHSDAQIVIFTDYPQFLIREKPDVVGEFLDMTETVKEYKVKLFETTDDRKRVDVLVEIPQKD